MHTITSSAPLSLESAVQAVLGALDSHPLASRAFFGGIAQCCVARLQSESDRPDPLFQHVDVCLDSSLATEEAAGEAVDSLDAHHFTSSDVSDEESRLFLRGVAEGCIARMRAASGH